MKKWPLVWNILVVVLLLTHSAPAFDIPSPPTADIYLADYAAMVNTEDRKKILDIGNDMDKRFGAQLVVVTVSSLDGPDIETYSNKLFRSWGIGDAKKNNGVLLLIAKEDRQFRIEVGYGLEGAVTDGYAGEVLDTMKKSFKNGEYSGGILSAFQNLAGRIYGEYGAQAPESLKAADPPPDSKWTPEDYGFLAVFVIITMMLVVGVIYLFNVLCYVVTFGHFGTLSFRESCSLLFGWLGGSDDGGSGGSRGSGGFGGGSSGGGGASGRW
ncbi:MAG: TPM domain-containing protein [Desulfovibrio sp.]|nr:TPM domain-containing protein [Desulfovibrio sp.]